MIKAISAAPLKAEKMIGDARARPVQAPEDDDHSDGNGRLVDAGEDSQAMKELGHDDREEPL